MLFVLWIYASRRFKCCTRFRDNKIDVSDKRYKVYVRRPGVINASAGAIKFYNWHLPSEVDAATNLLERINTRAALTLQKLKQAGEHGNKHL